MFIHWFYPLLLYIYYQNTQQKTEQRKHGKQGGGEDNDTVWHHATQSNEITHTPHVHKVHMHVPKTQRYQTERPEFRGTWTLSYPPPPPKPRNPPPPPKPRNPKTPPPPRNPEPPPPENPETPPMYETARPVYKKDINTSFTLGSRSEKMRADEGSEGTTTTTTFWAFILVAQSSKQLRRSVAGF